MAFFICLGSDSHVFSQEGSFLSNNDAENDSKALLDSQGKTDDESVNATSSTSGGNASLVCSVYDAEDGTEIEGVGVIISEIGVNTVTNDLGECVIDSLKPKAYKVTFVSQGYKIETVEIKIIRTGRNVHEQPMERKAFDGDLNELEEIEVLGDPPADGGGRMIPIEDLPGLKSSIGSVEFSKQDIGDAAGAVSRVAGANIVDGRYAVIRGLGDRYSSTTVNGAIIPSSDPSKKAVQLDLFPTDLVQDLVISKTFTPNLTGEFAGGVVDIRTLKFPKEPIINFGTGLKWNNSTGNKIGVNPDRSMDFFGRTNDDLPDVGGIGRPFPTGVNRANRDGSISSRQQDAIDAWGKIHRNGSWKSKFQKAKPNRSVKFLYGDSYQTDFGEPGVVYGFTHDIESSMREGVKINRGAALEGDFAANQGQVRDVYTESIDWGMLLNAGVELSEDHSLWALYMTNVSAEDKFTRGRNIYLSEDSNTPIDNRDRFTGQFGLPGTRFEEDDDENPFGASGTAFRAYDEFAHLERNISTSQIAGDHRLNAGKGIGLNWLLSNSNASEERPDLRLLRGFQFIFDEPHPEYGESVETIANILWQNPSSGFREFLSTNESGQEAKMDLTIPIIGKLSSSVNPNTDIDDEPNFLELQGGVSHFDRKREVRGRFFQYGVSSRLSNAALRNPQFGVDLFDDFDSVIVDGIRSVSKTEGVIIKDQSRGGNTVRNVDASSLIKSAYMMGTLNWRDIEFISGARIEREVRNYYIDPDLNQQSLAEFLNPDSPVENEYLLPSATLRFGYAKDDEGENKQSISLAYGRTLARPTFYEYAPIRTVDQSTGLAIVGNQELVDTDIDNYDARWSWEPTPGESVALSVFHKNMTNPIVTTVDSISSSNFERSWQNANNGSLQGAEIELRKYLEESNTWLLTTNFTYIDSVISGVLDKDTGLPIGSASVFEGQPTYIFNINLGFDHENWGLTSNLIYNWTSEILTDISADSAVPNIFLEPQHSFDFVISKTFNDSLKFKIAVKNIFDNPVRKFYEGEDLTFEEYRKGRSYSFGLSYDF